MAPADLEPGSVFAGHRIEAIAGRGGMGVVYRARHLALDHIVALKVITPELAHDELFRGRFQRESRLAVSIRHPNVIRIHHAGEENGVLFVTMDFIEGYDLRSLFVDHGRLHPRQAAGILMQVASALDAAHERGLVHRDVKPANVLIERTPEGEHVYLTDFGLTKEVAGVSSGLTRTGTVMGTIDYMAPEQIRGDRLDARADVYALGCVAYEVISGRLPFIGGETPVARMYAHLEETPDPIQQHREDLGPAINAVIQRALAKDPGDRHPSAGDFGRALLAAAEGSSIGVPERSVAVGAAAPSGTPEADQAPTTPPSSPAVPTLVPAAEETQLSEEPSGGHDDARPTEFVAGRPPVASPPHPPPSEPRQRPREGLTMALGMLAVTVLFAAGAFGVTQLTGGDEEPASSSRTGATENPPSGPDAPEVEQIALGDELEIDAAASRFIDVSGSPVGGFDAFGYLWTANRGGNTLTQINTGQDDPSINGVEEFTPSEGSGPESVYIDSEVVWVTLRESSQLARFNVYTGDEIGAPASTGGGPTGLGVNDDGVFVANSLDGTVTQHDLETGAIDDTIEVGAKPYGIAIRNGYLWVVNRDDDTIQILARQEGNAYVALEAVTVGDNPHDVAIFDREEDRESRDDDLLAVSNSADGTVWLLDKDGRQLAEIDVEGEPRQLTPAGGYIWAAMADGRIIRIDPTASEARPIQVGGSPETISLDERGRIWVTLGTDGTVMGVVLSE